MTHPLWTAAKGAAKFAAAYIAGDIAPDREREARRTVCLNCPSRVRAAVAGAFGESDWCGQPFTETSTTCGCLIAGKISVASEFCP